MGSTTKWKASRVLFAHRLIIQEGDPSPNAQFLDYGYIYIPIDSLLLFGGFLDIFLWPLNEFRGFPLGITLALKAIQQVFVIKRLFCVLPKPSDHRQAELLIKSRNVLS